VNGTAAILLFISAPPDPAKSLCDAPERIRTSETLYVAGVAEGKRAHKAPWSRVRA